MIANHNKKYFRASFKFIYTNLYTIIRRQLSTFSLIMNKIRNIFMYNISYQLFCKANLEFYDKMHQTGIELYDFIHRFSQKNYGYNITKNLNLSICPQHVIVIYRTSFQTDTIDISVLYANTSMFNS